MILQLFLSADQVIAIVIAKKTGYIYIHNHSYKFSTFKT